MGSPFPETDPLTSLDVCQVRVGGEIGRRLDITRRVNFHAIDLDNHFLRPFLERDYRPYIGLGKLIDAAVQFCVYSSDPQTVAAKDHLVSETIRAQLADGYIGTMPPADRMRQEYDIHEMGYLVLGLAVEARRYRNRSALEAAAKLADYIIDRWQDRNPQLTTLGIAEGFMALAAASGQRRYLEFCAGTPMGRLGNMPLREWRYPTQGHVYRYLATASSQLDLYREELDEGLLVQTQQALDFLTAGNGMVITGTCSLREAWHDDQVGEGQLGETCATAYLLRLLDNALRLTGDVRCGDLMERTLYNALFAAQSPDGRRLRYFTPFQGRRYYFGEQSQVDIDLVSYDTSCCPNNYRRMVAELPSKVYYRAGEGLFVNLYTPSSVRLQLASGVVVAFRQETDYPNTGSVAIHVDPAVPAAISLWLRIPRWCRSASVQVAGEGAARRYRTGQCVQVQREWKPGDRVALTLSLPWRTIRGRAAQEGRIAVARGPVIYCLSPGRNGVLADLDVREITLDPASLAGPQVDEAVRPDGRACRVRAWRAGEDFARPTDLDLLLTEFPDPTGEATYFRAPEGAEAVEDELAEPFGLGDDRRFCVAGTPG